MSLGWAVKGHMNEDIMDTIKAAENSMYRNKLFESPGTRGNIIHSIMNTLNGISVSEKRHSERISNHYEKIATAFSLSEKNIEDYKTACMFHDIGMIAIDQSILKKAEKLNQEEWEEIRRHPEVGYRILNAVPDFAEIAEYVLAHHERWDGQGYPKGLKGEEIPYIARLIAIAGAYDAMTSARPYRKALSEDAAIDELIKNAGTQFDPDIARIFIEKVLGRKWDSGKIAGQ
jgi:HD-GYP domain-containing protein (c-di-GMP phosphodiesterase class II)